MTEIMQKIGFLPDETEFFLNLYSSLSKEILDEIEVLKNDDDYKQLVDKAEQDFLSYKQKYEEIIQLNDLKNIIYKNL